MRFKRFPQIVLIILMGCSIFGCGSGGSGGGTVAPPAPTGEVQLSVSGTTVSVFSGDELVSSDNTKGKSKVDTDGDGIPDAYNLRLTNIPLNKGLRIYLESGGTIYPLLFPLGSGTTNVFSLSNMTPFNFGFVALIKGVSDYTASPENNPCVATGLQCSALITSIPSELLNPDTTGLTLSQLNEKGLDAIAEGSVLKARAYFEKAEQLAGTQNSNPADTARFFYSLMTVLSFGFDRLSDNNPNNGFNKLGDILDSFGMDTTDDIRINADQYPIPPKPLPSNAASGADIQTFALDKVLPEILKAIAAANKISSTFSQNWTVPIANEVVESDYGDALLCRAGLNAILSKLYAQAAYSLEADLAKKANDDQSIQQFLSTNTSFGNIKPGAAANLSLSKGYLKSALEELKAAILEIEAETDDQSDDFISLSELFPAEIAQAKSDIEDALASLNNPTFVNDNEDPSKGFTLNLSPFFAGSVGDLRTLLPNFRTNFPGVFPDPTMRGVLPNNELALNQDLNSNAVPDILEDAGLIPVPFQGWPY